MKHDLTLCIALTLIPLATAGGDDAWEHGVRSVTPAKRWEDAFVTGNGRMGAMLFGGPSNETFVANHCRLFLPLGNREIVPDLAQHVPELRRIIRDKGYGEAMRFFLGKAKEQGYPGLTWTDPFHPGLFINIRQPADGPVERLPADGGFRHRRGRRPLARPPRRVPPAAVRLAHRQPHRALAHRAGAVRTASSPPSTIS